MMFPLLADNSVALLVQLDASSHFDSHQYGLGLKFQRASAVRFALYIYIYIYTYIRDYIW